MRSPERSRSPPHPSKRRATREGWLAAPIIPFFLLLFLMPLGLLAVVSLYTSPGLTAVGPTQYAKLAGEGFNWSVLFATLLQGVKAWRSPRSSAVSLFLVKPETDVLPIRMWSMLESTLDVRTAAVSGVLIATTALFVFVMDRVADLTRRLT